MQTAATLASTIALLAALTNSTTVLADPTPHPGVTEHFTPDRVQPHANYVQALINAVSTERLAADHQALAARPHTAGSPGDADVITYLTDLLSEGADHIDVHEMDLYLAHPVSASILVHAPDLNQPLSLNLKENPLTEDQSSAHPELSFGWNAFSGSGEVTAQLVYANYATDADFARLAELKIDVSGKIVIARYGGNYRGYKATYAEAAGAAGLIIYSDPANDGYRRGPVYPEGGFANDTAIQRGSILNLPYLGDPLTPGIPADADADIDRLDPADVPLPSIPVQPIGYAAAQEILSRMQGVPVPDNAWQGGLPFRYRLASGPDLTVTLNVQQQRRITRTANVIATITGATHPNEYVLIGGHHDAWTAGAGDPLAGTICVTEAFRAFAALAEQGTRPARSIKFAAWGAEEYGIIGATEWVEKHLPDIRDNCIAYINLDMSALGTTPTAAAWPSVGPAILDAFHAVPSINVWGQSVADEWQQTRGDALPAPLGGGSDHVPLLMHAGVPAISLGARGAQGVAYHSAYDTIEWYRHVVGDDYAPARMVTQMTLAVAAYLANADLIPLDQAAFAPAAASRVDMNTLPDQRIPNRLQTLADLSGILAENTGHAIASNTLTQSQINALNAARRDADAAWIDDAGLRTRPFFRNTFVSTDNTSGYASWILPELEHARRGPDPAKATQAAIDKITARIDSAIATLGRALHQHTSPKDEPRPADPLRE